MSKVGADDLVAGGADAAVFNALPRLPLTPSLADAAYQGLAGRIVRTIEPYSESDPAAGLLHVLVGFGNLIGRGPYCMVERTPHYLNEFVALVGQSAKARKGQAWSTPRALLEMTDQRWTSTRVKQGLSSGEGLIYHVRDEQREMQPIKERGRVVGHEEVLVDAGESDKRLLIFESEMASVLKRMNGETNTVSALLRQAWDGGVLSTLTRNNPLRATGAHVSVIAHITKEELVAQLTETERANGLGNRFLFALVRRSKLLPRAEPPPDGLLGPLSDELQRAGEFGRVSREMRRDEETEAGWDGLYRALNEEGSGPTTLVDAVTARGDAHTMRLSALYAVLDCSTVIRAEHLAAAAAVWDYCDRSARLIFGGRFGLPVTDTILSALRGKPEGIAKTGLHALLGRNLPASALDAALDWLASNGQAHPIHLPTTPTGGRPGTLWREGPAMGLVRSFVGGENGK